MSTIDGRGCEGSERHGFARFLQGRDALLLAWLATTHELPPDRRRCLSPVMSGTMIITGPSSPFTGYAAPPVNHLSRVTNVGVTTERHPSLAIGC
jgi:hypothetical protein